MKNSLKNVVYVSACVFSSSVMAESQEVDALKKEIELLRSDYQSKLIEIENKMSANASSQTSFNPQISIILDGRFASFKNDPEDYELPGFALGGESGLGEEGFNVGHTEILMSANIDDKFFGQTTLAIANHEGEIEVELEEAFIDTLALPAGFTLRAGRFFSAVGYHNQQHNHAWDFADAPLVYAGLWGNTYIDNGMRLSWLAPTPLFFELGVEALSGGGFPAGGEPAEESGSQVVFANLGGDIGASHSWQLGMSFFNADVEGRQSGAHSHGAADEEIPEFTGESESHGLSAVYKWAPQGNYKNRYLKIQGEFFKRSEEGDVVLLNSDPLEQTTYEGEQQGFYVQSVYQFKPQWRIGLRYDRLSSDNIGSVIAVMEEAGLDDEGVKPERVSAMLEWVPSEFSRVRFQYNQDDSYEESDEQFFLQYTMSLGAHGAHSF